MRASGLAGLAILGGVVVLGVVGPYLGYDVVGDAYANERFAGPSAAHWLGTDRAGRDIAWRMVVAARHFVVPGVLACAICALVGGVLGTLAGAAGGVTAAVGRFVFTVADSIPRFVLVLLVLSIHGNDPTVLAVAAGVAYAPTLGEALHERLEGLRAAETLAASRAHGVPGWRLLLLHQVWGACRRRVARHLTGLFGYFLVLETTLSYLGFGVQQPQPSWGNMLAFDLDYGQVHWVALLAPAAAIWVVVAATVWVRASLAEDEHG